MTWWGNLGSRPLILFKWLNTAPLYSFKFMGPKFKLRNFRCHASWKRIHGALNLHSSSYISKIVWGLPMFDFGILCHLLRLMGIYWVGPPVRVFEKLRSLFFFLLHFCFFLFFSSFSFFLSLGAPLAQGPLDIVHPCHPVATPLTACWQKSHPDMKMITTQPFESFVKVLNTFVVFIHNATIQRLEGA